MKEALDLRWLRGVLLVAATYGYFLLFAQYGLLRLVASRMASLGERDLDPVLAAMGISGLAASLLTPFVLRSRRPAGVFRLGFGVCAVAAFLALGASTLAAFGAIAVLVGLGLGAATVALASRLRPLIGSSYGLAVGLGTGIAYGCCNAPIVFDADPRLQAILSVLVAALAAALYPRSRETSVDSDRECGSRSFAADQDTRGLGFTSLVLGLLALVWLDSAAFRVIQETTGLKNLTWGSPALQLVQGFTHLFAATAAGALFDRGLLRSQMGTAFGLFVIAFAILGTGGPTILAGPLYAAGISIYSTLLVAYPSASPDAPGQVPRRWRAAAVFGVAGWLGSALGIGMAQNLHTIPRAFVLAGGAVLLGGAMLRHLDLRTLVRNLGPTTLAAAAVFALALVGQRRPAAPPPAPISAAERGRAVYIAEGCLHCHSQYVRPRSAADIEAWGPARDPSRDGDPPLIGNRRQGPDLLDVGNRRSPEWHRLHLLSPRSVSPGSRMPSYRHLFAAADPSGEALVAYLSSLGAATATERAQIIEDARLPDAATLAVGDTGRGRELFALYCTSCHGADGRGDGELAQALGERAGLDLRLDAFAMVSWDGDDDDLGPGLARVIRYGLPGSPMPGHETMEDRDLADLVAWVSTLPESVEDTEVGSWEATR